MHLISFSFLCVFDIYMSIVEWITEDMNIKFPNHRIMWTPVSLVAYHLLLEHVLFWLWEKGPGVIRGNSTGNKNTHTQEKIKSVTTVYVCQYELHDIISVSFFKTLLNKHTTIDSFYSSQILTINSYHLETPKLPSKFFRIQLPTL